MKNLNDLNHYEILQIPIDASRAEIEKAYEDALSVYGVDAVSTYCLFSENERETILELIETAYVTLIDNDKRAAYNDELAASGQFSDSIVSENQTTYLSPSLSCYLDRKRHLPDSNVVGQGYGNHLQKREIMQLLDSCRQDIDLLKNDRLGVKNRLKLSWMKEKL